MQKKLINYGKGVFMYLCFNMMLKPYIAKLIQCITAAGIVSVVLFSEKTLQKSLPHPRISLNWVKEQHSNRKRKYI